MTAITKNQCRALVYHLFLLEGWLPAGTTPQSWAQVTMGQMQFDDPPLPSEPHFQKKRLALELQAAFIRLGSSIPSPLAELKNAAGTLGDLAVWCYQHQPSP